MTVPMAIAALKNNTSKQRHISSGTMAQEVPV